MTKYFDDWCDYDDMVDSFKEYCYHQNANIAPEGIATKGEVVVAACSADGYSVSAYILFERGGKLYEVFASHCSCFGLEGQWDPEETTWEAMALRPWGSDGYGAFHSEEFYAHVSKLIKQHAPITKGV